jgi:Kelch motif
MRNSRAIHRANLLNDGRVLVTGGGNDAGILSSSEVYDPNSDTWAPAGSLNSPRSRHVAVVLSNGQVLVAGGRATRGGPSLPSAELYDPEANAWTATGSMASARFNFAAVRLFDGRVLVSGGLDPTAAPRILASAEVHDPAAGSWAHTRHMLNARFGHAMTLLSDGRVLVAGGNTPGGDDAPTRTAEIYDPGDSSWTMIDNMHVARSFFSAAMLADQTVLVAGGNTYPLETRTATAEIYEPVTEKWRSTGSMAVARGGFGMPRQSVTLADGAVLIAGDVHDDLAQGASVELYEPTSKSWSFTGGMSANRKDHATAQLADGRILVMGGVDGSVLATAEVYTP